jgi:hypothetical protein
MERFIAHFGANPGTCRAVFSDLQTTQIKEAQAAKPSIVHFLMAMFWLKTYPSEPMTAGTFKVDEKTARTQVWRYILAIQGLKAQKVNKLFALHNSYSRTSHHLSCSLLTSFLL